MRILFLCWCLAYGLVLLAVTPVTAQQDQALPIPKRYHEASATFSSILDKLERRNNTLYQALESAYRNNPALMVARQQFDVTTERLPQASAGYKPTITGEADITYTHTETEGQSCIYSDGGNTSKGAALNIEQPLYRGGTTLADIGSAKKNIRAALFALSAKEQDILYQTAEIYMDVLRDMALVQLRQNNHSLLDYELARARSRFEVGELTRTDVSQSQARLAQSRADLITAQGNLRSSRARYQQITGVMPPENIAFPAKSLMLPESLEEALDVAGTNNRGIIEAQYIGAAAQDDVDSRFGDLLPQISAQGRLSKIYDQSDFIEEQDQHSVGLKASIPLYRGGTNLSKLREAKKRAAQRHLEIHDIRSQTQQNVQAAWEDLRVARAAVEAREAQIRAANIAKEGVLYETEFGERTTLDALNATQELLEAQIQLVEAKRGEVVARFMLARLLGLLVPQNLGFETIPVK
ncbi:MAG: TolC family outer membrane protein [Alphaproteobacteria bacterium]|nr:TolC family outer membrane protein [Alphaproteobacteria bacterium]